MDYPTIDSAVAYLKSTFFHDFFDVSITQAVSQVPAHRLHNHVLVKMAATKADHMLLDPWIVGRPVYHTAKFGPRLRQKQKYGLKPLILKA